MSMRLRELEMIRCACMSEHHAVETIVVLKSMQNFQPEDVSIKTSKRFYIVGGTGDAWLGGAIRSFQ